MNESIIETVITEQTDKVKILKNVENLLVHNKIINKDNIMLKDIELREQKGSIEIYPNILLPHIKATYVKETRILLIKNNKTFIKWTNEVVDLIILILIPEKPNNEEQEEIRTFMKNLAHESYIKKLMKKE